MGLGSGRAEKFFAPHGSGLPPFPDVFHELLLTYGLWAEWTDQNSRL